MHVKNDQLPLETLQGVMQNIDRSLSLSKTLTANSWPICSFEYYKPPNYHNNQHHIPVKAISIYTYAKGYIFFLLPKYKI